MVMTTSDGPVYTIQIHVLRVEHRGRTYQQPGIIPFDVVAPADAQPPPAPTDAAEPSLLVRVPQAAKILGMSERKLYYLLGDPHSGLTSIHIGRSAYIERADLARFVALLKQKAPPPSPVPSVPVPRPRPEGEHDASDPCAPDRPPRACCGDCDHRAVALEA